MTFTVHNNCMILKEPMYTTKEQNGDLGSFGFVSAQLVLGNNVHIANSVTIIGKGVVTLENGATVGPGVIIYTSMPNIKKLHKNKFGETHEPIVGDVYIGKNVMIGANSVIGAGAVIEEGTVLPPLTHIKPFTKYKMEYLKK